MVRLFSLLIGYLLGNILTAELVARCFVGKSAFTIGSGNPGMANIAAQCGTPYGVLVLAGDFGKTLLSCLLCRFILFPEAGATACLYAGLGVVLGHVFPFWHRFRGGKGVACTCTALLCLSPLWGALACLAGLAVVLCTRYLSFGGVAVPALFLVPAFWYFGPEAGAVTLLLTLLTVWTFRAAWPAIRQGTEHQTALFRKHNR